MVAFTKDRPVETAVPFVRVDDLPSGVHRFQLVAEDESGNRSQPDIHTVTINSSRPTITRVIPTHGHPRDRVVIHGTNFAADPQKNQVSFGNVATGVVEGSATSLTVTVPRGAQTSTISVETGEGVAKSPDPFFIPRTLTMGTGDNPVDLAFDKEHDEIWVVNSPTGSRAVGSVSILSIKEQRATATINVGPQPVRIAVGLRADRRQTALVINRGDRTVSLIDVPAKKLIAVVKLGIDPKDVAISPDGRWGYVVGDMPRDLENGRVAVIDLLEGGLATLTRVSPGSAQVVFGNDKLAFVACEASGTVDALDVPAHTLSKSVLVGNSGESNPLCLAVPSSTFPFWSANAGVRGCSVIDSDFNVVNHKIEITPGWATTTTTGDTTFFAGSLDRALVRVVIEKERISPLPLRTSISLSAKNGKMPAPGGSFKGIAATSDGERVLVVHPARDTVSLFNGKSLDFMLPLQVAPEPRSVLIDPENRFACILSGKGRMVTVLILESIR